MYLTQHEMLAINTRNLRKQYGWTQYDLSSRMGLSSTTVVSAIELAKHDLRLSSLARLADALNTTIPELLAVSYDHEPEHVPTAPESYWETSGSRRID